MRQWIYFAFFAVILLFYASLAGYCFYSAGRSFWSDYVSRSVARGATPHLSMLRRLRLLGGKRRQARSRDQHSGGQGG